jgi:hypothetical protein
MMLSKEELENKIYESWKAQFEAIMGSRIALPIVDSKFVAGFLSCTEILWPEILWPEIERLKLDKEHLEFIKQDYFEIIQDLKSEVADLERKLSVAKSALEFYADRNNWKCWDTYSEVKDVITFSDISAKNHKDGTHYMIGSGGNRARAALKEIE